MTRILDPGTKIILLILGIINIRVSMSFTFETIIILIYVFPLLVAGLYKSGITFILIYSVQVSASIYLLPYVEGPFLLYIVSFLSKGLRILMPCIIAGFYFMKTTPVSDLIAALKKLNAPNWLLIPIAVIARFFPTVSENYKYIRNAMAFRGIGRSFTDLIKHPMQTLEFILIPLLMNGTEVAEDLTVSALTKGLSLPGRHTSIVSLKMTGYDWIYLLIIIVLFGLYLGGVIL